MVAIAYPRQMPLDSSQTQAWWSAVITGWLRNPVSFVTQACWTEDPTNVQDPMNPNGPMIVKNPIRRIPREDFIVIFVHKYLSPRRVLAIPKSRRMIVTWTACALDLHTAMWTPSAQVYIASKDQTDSDKLVQRCLFIYQHLPREMPKPHVYVRHGKEGNATVLEFEETNSKIIALNQKPDDLRQEGATLLHVEEFGFWEWQERSYTAMLPTTMGGGKVRVICSAINGTFWSDVVNDKTVSHTREAF